LSFSRVWAATQEGSSTARPGARTSVSHIGDEQEQSCGGGNHCVGEKSGALATNFALEPELLKSLPLCPEDHHDDIPVRTPDGNVWYKMRHTRYWLRL
jgi:hypothetical protein